MTDAIGHADRPGAGPLSAVEVVNGIPSNHYTHENPETGMFEVVKINPPGTLDTVVKEFSDRISAKLWIHEEWLAGRIR